MRNRTSIRGIITAVSAVISTIQHLECHFLLASSKTLCPNHSSKCRIRSNLDSRLVLRLSTQHRCRHQDRTCQCKIPLRQTMLIIAKLNLKQASSRQWGNSQVHRASLMKLHKDLTHSPPMQLAALLSNPPKSEKPARSESIRTLRACITFPVMKQTPSQAKNSMSTPKGLTSH